MNPECVDAVTGAVRACVASDSLGELSALYVGEVGQSAFVFGAAVAVLLVSVGGILAGWFLSGAGGR